MITTESGGGARSRRAQCGCASPADGAPGRLGPEPPRVPVAPRPGFAGGCWCGDASLPKPGSAPGTVPMIDVSEATRGIPNAF